MYENLILETRWKEAIKARYVNSSLLLKSGVVDIDNNSVFKGGTIISDQAFFNALTTRMQQAVKGTALNSEAYTMGHENMICFSRYARKIFYAQDLRRIGITENADSQQILDKLDVILGMTTDYLGIELEIAIWNVLSGIFGALAATHVHTATGAISLEDAITAKGKLGQFRGNLTDFFCTPTLKDEATLKDLTKYALVQGAGDQIYKTGTIETIANLPITETLLMQAVPDDPVVSPYNSYMFSKNCIYFAPAWTNVASAYYPEIGGGQLNVVVGVDMAIHVPGVTYATAVGTDPSNAELATSTTWSLVAPALKVQMVKLITQ
jgi:hypothetical protein